MVRGGNGGEEWEAGVEWGGGREAVLFSRNSGCVTVFRSRVAP